MVNTVPGLTLGWDVGGIAALSGRFKPSPSHPAAKVNLQLPSDLDSSRSYDISCHHPPPVGECHLFLAGLRKRDDLAEIQRTTSIRDDSWKVYFN